MPEVVKPGKNDESFRLAKFWLDHIDQVDQLQKNWTRKGDIIIKRFRDERSRSDETVLRRLNLLWANIKILMPALYGKPPIPYVERKFLQRDPVARLSSQILERTLKNEIDINGLHTSIRRAVLDYLLPGRGIVWVRYEPSPGQLGESIPVEPADSLLDDISDIEDDTDQSPKVRALRSTGDQLETEQAPVDYIHWKDLYLFPATARTWDEVEAVGKRVYLSKKDAITRFGEEIGSQLRYNNTAEPARRVPFSDTAIFQSATQNTIEVIEIWNKVDRNVYWVCSGYNYLCDVKKDPLKLINFFPVPQPLSATLTNESLVPVPDYIEYQDQAIQIDELTQRLSMLTKACKVAGCYDASNGSVKRLFQEGFENDLIPVDAWAAFAEKGGVQGAIALLPIEEIQKVIETLTKVRQQLMMDLDLVTGISDIIRGTTDSRETLGGIRLKNNNAGTRLSDRQAEVAQFVRNTLAIVAEVCSKFYSDEKLIESSGILYDEELQPEAIIEEFATPPQPQNQPQAQGNQIPGQNQAPSQGAPVQQSTQQDPIFQGGINSLQQPFTSSQGQDNVLQFPNLNPKAPPAINSPMGIAPAQPMFDDIGVDPYDVITYRLEEAIDLLRNDVPRCYRIDIETDSTIFGDVAQERQDAAQFIGEVSKFLAGAAQLGAQLPEAVPALSQMLLWGIRKFRIGRDLESSFDDFVNKVNKRVKQQIKNPKPSPEEQKAQADLEATKLETSAKAQEMQMQHQHLKESNQMEMQKQQGDHAIAQQQSQMDMQLKQQEHQMKLEEMQMKHKLEMAKMQMEMQKMQAELHMQGQQHQMQMEQSHQQHEQAIEQTQMQGEQAKQEHQQALQQTEMKGAQAEEQHTQKMEQTKLAGEQQQKAHDQKIQQTKLTGQQQQAKHNQTMAQAKIRKKGKGKAA